MSDHQDDHAGVPAVPMPIDPLAIKGRLVAFLSLVVDASHAQFEAERRAGKVAPRGYAQSVAAARTLAQIVGVIGSGAAAEDFAQQETEARRKPEPDDDGPDLKQILADPQLRELQGQIECLEGEIEQRLRDQGREHELMRTRWSIDRRHQFLAAEEPILGQLRVAFARRWRELQERGGPKRNADYRA